MRALTALLVVLVAAPAEAQPSPPSSSPSLPQGYLVWVKGKADDAASRKIFRLTLPERTEERALTEGEDVEPQVSPDGRWVAYAKAKLPGGSDYHDPGLWKVYLVSIHGAGDGRREIKIDDDGAWPSWGAGGALFYNQADGTHTRLVRVELDARGQVVRRQTIVSTRQAFGGFTEVNEIALSGDEGWFAGRTRGNATQNGVFAFTLDPLAGVPLARAGDVGCMPRVARGGGFGLIAGAGHGIRWGHGPSVPGRQQDQLLIPPRTPQHLAYHPGISSDGRWVLASQGTEPDHNAGRYDLELRALDPQSMQVGEAELLTSAGFNGWPDLWVGPPTAPPPPSPEILELSSSSYTLAPGEAATLSWTTTGADQVTLDGEMVPPVGSREVTPPASTRYTLRAASSRGDAADTRTIALTVNATPRPVAVLELAAQPARVELGRSSRLVWKVENATTLDIDGAPVAPEGEREVTPRQSTTYVLTARGHGGPVEARVTLAVEARSTGLLPDRGGFRCSAGAGGGSSGPATLAILPGAALAGLVLRRARTRSPDRRRGSPRHPATGPGSPRA